MNPHILDREKEQPEFPGEQSQVWRKVSGDISDSPRVWEAAMKTRNNLREQFLTFLFCIAIYLAYSTYRIFIINMS